MNMARFWPVAASLPALNYEGIGYGTRNALGFPHPGIGEERKTYVIGVPLELKDHALPSTSIIGMNILAGMNMA